MILAIVSVFIAGRGIRLLFVIGCTSRLRRG